jgi:anti-sigma factor RsiW
MTRIRHRCTPLGVFEEEDMASEPDITDGLSDDELADLARLADGTLPAERRAEVEARVAASPQLARMVERQAAALEALRATADIGAPARLRAEIDRRRGSGHPARRRLSRFPIRTALAATAAAALALGLVLPGALQSGPSFAEAAALAQKPPTQAAPAGAAGTPQLLRASVDGVPFPNYGAKFGWKPIGARADGPSGRHAATVYYKKAGRTIAYTIVSGDALDTPADARSTTRGGVEYRAFRDDGRTVITWERGGHTCVLSSVAVRPAELVALADWRGKGAIRF